MPLTTTGNMKCLCNSLFGTYVYSSTEKKTRFQLAILKDTPIGLA